MTALYPDIDPGGLLEYSVVYTDRSLNHMSRTFQDVMRDISRVLKQVYHARSAVVIPGSGTVGMEAVARQFANDQDCLVVRNGWFSYRWTQIMEMGRIPRSCTVLKARQVGDGGTRASFAPVPAEEVAAEIAARRPAVVFAPHVETSAGMMLPDAYLRTVADAVHAVGGLFVLDCVASGAMWVDMEATGVDVLITAPQKGWSSSPCAGLVMLSERARARIDETTSSSFALDLRKWLQIMETYEGGGHAYHATLPTDGLRRLAAMMAEAEATGFETLRQAQQQLGERIRAALEQRGFRSVAAEGFKAPAVVVSYTDDSDLQNGRKFMALGMQIAAGVPLQVDEPADFKTFRIGLFGLDKLLHVERTVKSFEEALAALA